VVSAVAGVRLAPEEVFAPYEWLREIGARPNPLCVVRQRTPGARPRLLIAERFADVARAGDAAGAAFVAQARRISTLASPNLGRVRELAVRGDDLAIFWELIDGDKLAEVWPAVDAPRALPLDLALRLILDVLSGVGAIHGLRDARQQPMDLSHGEVSPATVVVGVDGAARVLHAIARRQPAARAEPASLGYLAPEVHTGGPYDARADVFSVGVLLWEALSGKRLFVEETDAAAVVARLHGGIPLASVPGKASWALGLAQIAAKAMAPTPADRWPTASAMAAEIRKIAGLRLASATAAAAFVGAALGERARIRRAQLESLAPSLPRTASPVSAGAPASVPAAVPSDAELDAELDLVAEALASLAPPAPRPPLPARALKPSPPTSVATTRAPVADAPEEPPPAWPVQQVAAAYFEAAVDLPISIAPPPGDPPTAQPASVPPDPGVAHAERLRRRRMIAVLGGVAAFGVLVFCLVGWRLAHDGGRLDALFPARDRVRAAQAEVLAPTAAPPSTVSSAWHAVSPRAPGPESVSSAWHAVAAAPPRADDSDTTPTPVTTAPPGVSPRAPARAAAPARSRPPARANPPGARASWVAPPRKPVAPRAARPNPQGSFDPASL
jgi:Protein kinase domain